MGVTSSQCLLFVPAVHTASWNVSLINQLNSTVRPIDVMSPIIRHYPQQAATLTEHTQAKSCPIKGTVHPNSTFSFSNDFPNPVEVQRLVELLCFVHVEHDSIFQYCLNTHIIK